MNRWRLDLTVFTDLSASLFAACFMILLIFLHLAQALDAARTRNGASAPIEARERFRIVERAPLAPEAMVAMLFRHRGEASGVSLDLFADRVEIGGAGLPTVAATPEEAAAALRTSLPPGGDIRLYVLSPRFYDRTLAALDGSNLAWTEISVPRALTDGTENPRGWRAAFTEMEASEPTPEAFRAGLAQLLEGGEEQAGGAPGGAAEAPAGGGGVAGPSLTDRLAWLAAWLGRVVAVAALVAGFGLVAATERQRLARLRG